MFPHSSAMSNMKSAWIHPAQKTHKCKRHTHEHTLISAYVCWTLTFKRPPHPPTPAPDVHRDTMTRKHWAGFFTCTNIPDEILSICGGNLQPETGWLQTRGAADHHDGWGRWFVECLKHKSKHLFSVTWEFLFSCVKIFLPQILEFCWQRAKVLRKLWHNT